MPTAVITGATHGMGRAIAEKLLANGYSVAVCARSAGDLEKVKAAWQAQYPSANIMTVEADISVKEEADAFADAVLARFPAPDVFVNNAGTFAPGTITEGPEAELNRMMGLNFYAAFHLVRKFAPGMKQRRHGHIFTICSVAALWPHPESGIYSISKYALLGLTENLRAELNPFDVKVTAVCPGSTATHSWDGEDFDASRLLRAADIAEAIWGALSMSPQANVDRIVMRPVKG